MINKRLFYYILTVFIAGNFLLVFAQYNSSRSIKNLIHGNEELVNEFNVTNELKELEKDVLFMENTIAGVIAVRDTTPVGGLELQINEVREDVNGLQKIGDNDSTVKYVDQLDRLIQEKLSFNHVVLDSFYHSGRQAAENLLLSTKGKQLTESILNVIHKIDSTRQGLLANIALSIDESGRKASNWGVILISFVICSGIGLFLFIINRIKQQQLLVQQLDASEKKVREVARIKENFLANMSHEIRTPLAAILGYTNLLQQKKLDDKDARLFVSTIQKSGETLLTIINDILDLSKIEAGMIRIEVAPFSIRELVHSIETIFSNNIREKGLQFNSTVDPGIPDLLLGDATRLTQILVNLMGNAIKFTDKGMISLHVSGQEDKPGSITLQFHVSDTGIGIEKTKLDSIFERFQQAEASTTRKYGGTGLGLSIVRDMIHLQGGEIHIESNPGSGTIVSFSIPYKISKEQSTDNREEELLLPKEFKKDLKILIVEDNLVNQGLLRHLLHEWNIAHTIVSNGKEAIEIVQKDRFDLILMDIQMPVMDGYTASRKIREQLHLDIPIIAMTAHAMTGEREKCLSYGMNEHLSKPIREHELYRMISQFVKKMKHPTYQADNSNKQYHTTGYQIIDLQYMKIVSKGNREYEKAVTEQFIELVPEEVAELYREFNEGNYKNMKRVAHSLKTSISVMGLNTKLDNELEAIESEELETQQLRERINKVIVVCGDALIEAGSFLKTL